MTTKTKYKVGDKVRILNVDEIIGGITHWNDGDITEVTGVKEVYGTEKVFLRRTKTEDSIFNPYLHRDELAYIEKVDVKPTKNQRISALESQVTELQAQVARLQGVDRVIKNVELHVSTPADICKIAEQLAEMVAGETAKLQPTPNELRKAIIAEARAFYSATLNEYQLSDGEVVVVSNDKERIISVTIRHLFSLKPLLSAKAKCAPGDVFNADIGKAIALGRALGLDVSKFEQAIQPTEVVLGHTVISPAAQVVGGVALTSCSEKFSIGFARSGGFKILNDTEAQYE